MSRIAAVLPLLLALPLLAQDKADERPASVFQEITPATQAAIDKGLSMMARRQQRNGGFEGSAPVATAAVCGLAFLASGSTCERGPYSDNIRRAVDFILRSAGRSGFITEANSGGIGGSGMHGHGYASLFLAEVCGTISDPDLQERVKEALQRAVKNIEETQNQYGGWNATPNRQATDDGSGAVAVMQITAMRAARNAGLEVDKGSIEKAVQYILKITSTDGWTQYNIHASGARGRGGSSALTGAGMTILNALGLYDEPKLKKGIENVMGNAPFLGKGGDSGWQTWYFYTAFYATLAIYQTGGDEWKRWWPAMRDDIVKRQAADGSWNGQYGDYGPIWSAFACLTLQMPCRFLPLYAEGGRGAEGRTK